MSTITIGHVEDKQWISRSPYWRLSRSSELNFALSKIKTGTVAHQSAMLGLIHAEPLAVGFDAMLRYAKAHEKRFESKLKEDYFLGPAYLATITGLRAMLNGDGAVAHELGISTDSKDNGVLEEMFWHCMSAGGFTEADL